MRWLALLLLVGCGGAEAEVTYCGLLVSPGADVTVAQKIERWTVRAFQSSSDARLHDVCYAAVGYSLQRVDRVADPRPDHAGGEVGGYADCKRGQIVLKSFEQTLPHELAHVAQGCDDASQNHLDWARDVYPVIGIVSACLDQERWESAHPNGCPWLEGGCPTQCPPGIRD